MNTTQIPDAISTRKRLVRVGNVAIAALVLSVALHFPAQGVSNGLWILGTLVAALALRGLRRAIDNADLPQAELDEYELARHLEAREEGLRWSLALSIAVFVLSGAVAFATRFWADPDGVTVALFFAKTANCQMILVPYIVARSLAGKINHDELSAQE